MSWQFRHKYVQSKVEKSIFHFIRLFSYVSTTHFFSISHIYIIMYCYGFYFDLIGHIEFQFLIRFYFIFSRLQIEIYYYVFTIIHLLEFESTFEAFLLVNLNSNL